MVLFLDSMCQYRLHAVLWLYIGILMRLLTAEPRSIVGLLFISQCPSATILLTPYLMVCDLQVSRAAGPMIFNTFTGHAVDRCDLPDRAGHFPPDIKVYAISNFLPSSFVLDLFFGIKLFAIKFSTGIFILCL